MIEDILYKMIRKALPSGLFQVASRLLGRDKAYHRPGTYRGIYDYYRSHGLDFRGKTVLEVGPGSQLFTAFFYLADGADQILVADPKVDPESVHRQLQEFNAFSQNPLGSETTAKIKFFRDTREIPNEYNGRIDLICSNNVLEHLPDLGSFYADNARLLSPYGESCHRVDVSDHTYHLFSKFPLLRNLGHRRSLYHLRYSNRAFQLLNDPKTYMNRKLLPVHLDHVRGVGLRIAELQRQAFPQVPIHPDLWKGSALPPAEDLHLTDFYFKVTH